MAVGGEAEIARLVRKGSGPEVGIGRAVYPAEDDLDRPTAAARRDIHDIEGRLRDRAER